VEQNLKEQLRVDGMGATVLNRQAQDVLALAMEDLSRNSTYFGGTEDPFDWETRRKAFYIARIGTVAQWRLRNLGDQMRDGNGVAYATGDAKADVQALMAKRATFKADADFWDQMRLLREANNIRREMELLKGRTAPFPTTPPPSGAPSPSSPRSGGQTLGRPQTSP
jgi:hypothetical protein